MYAATALVGDLTVTVYATMKKAVAFYRRCGFVELGRQDADDEGRPLAVVEMAWRV